MARVCGPQSTLEGYNMSISLKPSDAVAGGILDDAEVTLTNPRFEMWDYNGKVPTPVPALSIDLKVEGGDEEPTVQHWSMGNAKDFLPSKDGKSLRPVGSKTAISASSNGAVFLASLVNSGFPEDKIADDIGIIDGTFCHVIRQPAPKRPGLARTTMPGTEAREATVLVVDKIYNLPWDKKASKELPAGATAGADASTKINDKATEVIMGILAERPDGIAKQSLPALVFKAVKDDPDKNAVIQLAFKDEFLSSSPLWKYEGGKLTPGA